MRLDTVERPIDNLEQQRDALREQRDLMRSIGEFKAAAAIDGQIKSLGTSIGEAYDKLIAFYRALSPADRARLRIMDDAQLEAIIGKLERAKTAATALQGSLFKGKVSFQDFLNAFASSATDSFNNFIRRIAEGQNAFRSAGRAIKEFASSFANALAQMIVKALAFTAALYALSAITGLSPAALGEIIRVGVHHAGGIAGSAGGVKRQVDPGIFQAALRYHTGGIAGFAPDEVPAVLKRGEEVLTEGDPRHRANGGLDRSAEGQGITSIKNVNLFDRDQAAQELINTKAGQKAVLNIVRGNLRGLGLSG